jgi:hypothetical protein
MHLQERHLEPPEQRQLDELEDEHFGVDPFHGRAM